METIDHRLYKNRQVIVSGPGWEVSREGKWARFEVWSDDGRQGYVCITDDAKAKWREGVANLEQLLMPYHSLQESVNRLREFCETW